MELLIENNWKNRIPGEAKYTKQETPAAVILREPLPVAVQVWVVPFYLLMIPLIVPCIKEINLHMFTVLPHEQGIIKGHDDSSVPSAQRRWMLKSTEVLMEIQVSVWHNCEQVKVQFRKDI